MCADSWLTCSGQQVLERSPALSRSERLGQDLRGRWALRKSDSLHRCRRPGPRGRSGARRVDPERNPVVPLARRAAEPPDIWKQDAASEEELLVRAAGDEPPAAHAAKAVLEHGGFSPKKYRKVIHDACKAAGVAKMDPNQMRHSVLTYAKTQGTSDDRLGSFAGHRSRTTTAGYTVGAAAPRIPTVLDAVTRG